MSRRPRMTEAVPGQITVVPLQCAGLNRYEAEDESSVWERSSDPLGPEFCAATARYTAKRR